MNSQDDKQISQPLLATIIDDESSREQPFESSRIKTYGLTFSELSSLIYGYSSDPGILDLKALRPYWMKSINPERAVLHVHESLPSNNFQANRKLMTYNQETIEILFNNLWKRIVRRGNCILFVIKVLILISSFITPCVLDLLTNNLKITDYNQKVSIPLLGDGFTQQQASFIYSIVLVINMIAGLFIHTQYSFQNNKLRYEGRTILQYIMYRKQMDSRPKDNTNAEGEKQDEPDINNLMLSDSDTVMLMFDNFHACWFAIVSLAITLLLLFFKLRSALPIGLGLVLSLLGIVSKLTKKMVAVHPERMKVQDKRIGLTSNIVEGIKSIKYLCWESIFHGKLLELREKEFAFVERLKYLDCYSVVIWGTASISIITFTFIGYSLVGYDLSDANIFTDIAFFQMLIFPLNQLPWSIGFVGNGLISLKRIKSFLTREDAPESKTEQAEVTVASSSEYAIQVKTKALTWTKVNENKEGEKLFALRNLDLEIKPSTLNMFIGNIGSGKSALLQAMLGELRFLEVPESEEERKTFRDENKIITNGSIAYVPQNPWLQKKSVRENILFGKEFDAAYYKKCLEACDLLVDINTFKNGDKYDVGLNGANLSGGQRQRISLCRALYQDADIYLLDDILSAVDVGVGSILLQKAVLGLLQERRKTVIFVLSQYKYLKYADKIFLMRNGVLYEDKTSINEFINAAKLQSNHDSEIISTEISSSLNPESSLILGSNVVNTEERPQALQENVEKIEEQEEEENREQGEIKTKTMMSFINAMGKWTFIFILIGGALMQISKAWFDFWLRDYLAAHAKKQDLWFYLGSFEVTILVLMFISITCTAYRAWIFAWGNLRSARIIFKKLVPKVLYAKMPFFDENPVGRIIQRFSGDTWSLDYQFAFNWNILLNEVNTFFRILFVFVTQLPIILVVITPATGVFYVVQKKYRKVNREVKRIDSVYSGRFLTQLAETASGVAIIRSYKKENYMVKDFLERIRDNLLSRSIMETMCQWFAIRLSSLTIVISSSVLILSLYYKYYQGASTNYSDFALILLYALTSPLNFESMITWVAESEKELIGIERINQYLDNETEEKVNLNPQKPVQVGPQAERQIAITIDKESEKNLAALDEVIEDPNRSAVIGFKSVYLKYQKAGQDSYALKDINFSVKRGEKIALCGRTGSGKTTILNSLLKFYEVHKGEIKFYDENIENLCKQDLRSHIAVIPQFGFMYEATLKDNLDPYGIVPKENLAKVLEKGKEFMRKAAEKHKEEKEEEKTDGEVVNINLEEGETQQSDRIFDEGFIIEKGGSNLSNGEKQIINFMRVLLRNSNVVFLDEATSNVDPVTDELMHQALFEMCQNKTLIVITHRLDYLRYYDRVILLEGGEIVDEGNYEELMMKQNGKFKEFLHSGQ